MQRPTSVIMGEACPSGSLPASGRVFCISAVFVVGCAALFLCELGGFRVFDQSMWGIHSKESGILSPPEMLIFFGNIAFGIGAGIAALASAVAWFVQYFRHPHTGQGSPPR